MIQATKDLAHAGIDYPGALPFFLREAMPMHAPDR